MSTLVRSGVENEAESWTPIQAWLMSHRWQGRTVVIVHHEGKGGKPRGSSKREDVLDTMVGLKKQEEAGPDESVFQLTFTKSRDFYGADAEPRLLHFTIEDGLAKWRSEAVRDVRLERVKDMLAQGIKNKDIAQELGLTPGRVSQIVKEIRSGDNVVPFDSRRKRREDDEV